jgi:hypothetical protein
VGPIDNITGVICISPKGSYHDALEKFYTFNENKNGNQINDKCTIGLNKIPDIIAQYATAL